MVAKSTGKNSSASVEVFTVGMTDMEFRALKTIVSQFYDANNSLPMLKVLFRDKVENFKLSSIISTTDLLNILFSQDQLSSQNLVLLCDTISITKYFGLQVQIKELLPSFPDVKEGTISTFTPHRQKLIKFGMLLNPADVTMIDALYNMPFYKYTDSWSMITNLEDREIIREGEMKEFIHTLKMLRPALSALLEDSSSTTSSSEMSAIQDIRGAPTSAILKLDEELRELLRKLSTAISEGDVDMLRVLYTDLANVKSDLMNAKSAFDLFQLLIVAGILKPTDISVLFETTEVTGLKYLKAIIEEYETYPDEVKITQFSANRQHLFALAKDFSIKDLHTVRQMYEIPVNISNNPWKVITFLENEDIVKEDNLLSFIMNLKTIDLTAKVVDSTGGDLEFEEIKLCIPAGAIAEGEHVDVSLGQLTTDECDMPFANNLESRVSPIVSCGPSGTVFNKYCTLSFPHNAINEESWEFTVYVKKYFCDDWKTIECDDQNTKVSIQDGRCDIKTKHFCLYCLKGLVGKILHCQKKKKLGLFGKMLTEGYYLLRVRVWSKHKYKLVEQEEKSENEKPLDIFPQIFVKFKDMEINIDELHDGWKVVSGQKQTLQSYDIWSSCPSHAFHLKLNDASIKILRATISLTQGSHKVKEVTVHTDTPFTTVPTDTPHPSSATDTPHPSSAMDTPHPSSATDTPHPSSATDTPHPSSAMDTTHPSSATDTPHPSSATDTPHPSSAMDTPHPSSATDTPHPSSATDTPHPSSTMDTPHPSSATDTPHPSSATDTPHPSSAMDRPHPSSATYRPHPSSARDRPHASSATNIPHPSSATDRPHPSSATDTPHPSSATDTPHASPATNIPHPSSTTDRPHPSSATDTPHPSSATDTPHPSSSIYIPHPSSAMDRQHTVPATRTLHTKEPFCMQGITQNDFVRLQNVVSGWWKTYGDINQLKVLLRQFMSKMGQAALQNTNEVMGLFKLLMGMGEINSSNLAIIFEAVKICGLEGVEREIKKIPKFENFALKNVEICKFSAYRQKLIKFGIKLSESSIKTIGDLNGIDEKVHDGNPWLLICALEEGNIIKQEEAVKFIESLRDNNLNDEADILEGP